MLDLIIPVYNNKKGLYRTLFSIGTDLDKKIKVTIIDDCSTENYEDVENFFQKFFPIRIIKLAKNQGPGNARQYGLDIASQSYISFIDCGDTFVTSTTLREMIEKVEQKSTYDFYSWEHLQEDSDNSFTVVAATHNRIHGKIYKTDFLKKHNISFNPNAARANEDIGFNIACRMISQNYLEIDEPAVVWKQDGPSIVRANNNAFYYKEQNLGLAMNVKHAVDIALHNNVKTEIILKNIYEIMTSLYFFYLATEISRPEFCAEAFAGCYYFYKKCYRDCGAVNPVLMNECYFNTLISFLNEENCPIKQKALNINFVEFLQKLELTYLKEFDFSQK